MTLAEVYFDLGHFQEAIDAFLNTIQLDKDMLELVSHRLALALHYSGRLYEAAQTYEAALVHQAANENIYFDYGVTLQHQGKIIEANEKYNRAIQIRRDFPEVRKLWQKNSTANDCVRRG